jgi:hypothetical protein
MTSRNWCFTLNNPDDTDYPDQWPLNNIKLLIYQEEIGEEGTLHLQGYVEVIQPARMAALKKINPKCHWEKRMGSRLQAIMYCVKQESRLNGPHIYTNNGWLPSSSECELWVKNLEEQTTLKQSSKSSTNYRLSTIRERLSEGCSTSIEEIADNEFDLWVRYYRAFEKYLCMKTPPRNHSVDVHVLQGPTGTGKSKWAMDTYPGAYWKQRSNWWCGYQGHETVVLDEFYGWLPFDLLLRLCDRYPLLVESKEGQVQFVAKTIVITTNQLPASWYKSAYFPAFVRRVSKWHIMQMWGDHKEFDSYAQFCEHAVDNLITP